MKDHLGHFEGGYETKSDKRTCKIEDAEQFKGERMRINNYHVISI